MFFHLLCFQKGHTVCRNEPHDKMLRVQSARGAVWCSQELQLHFEDMQRNSVIAKDSLWSDLVSAGDSEHFARGRPQLLRM